MKSFFTLVCVCSCILLGCSDNVTPTGVTSVNYESQSLQGIWTLTKVESTKLFSSAASPYCYTEIDVIPEQEQIYYMNVGAKEGIVFLSSHNNVLETGTKFSYTLNSNKVLVTLDGDEEQEFTITHTTSRTLSVLNEDLRFTFEKKLPIGY
ncbi:MAG: hypothetical protein U0Y96_12280 [Candidatus Kapaibacterium sp.]